MVSTPVSLLDLQYTPLPEVLSTVLIGAVDWCARSQTDRDRSRWHHRRQTITKKPGKTLKRAAKRTKARTSPDLVRLPDGKKR